MASPAARIAKLRVRVGRVAVPGWAVFASLVLLGAAGQAVGPVLSGDVQGTTQVTGEQAIVLAGSAASAFTGPTIAEAVVVNDEGTSFTAAVQMYVGQPNVALALDLDNLSEARAIALMTLQVPTAVDVEVDASDPSKIEEAQRTKGTWLMKLGPGTDLGTLEIIIEPKDDAKPGFYNITGRIVQIGGGTVQQGGSGGATQSTNTPSGASGGGSAQASPEESASGELTEPTGGTLEAAEPSEAPATGPSLSNPLSSP